MAATKSTAKTPAKTATKSATARKSENVWTDEERAAMQESARERKAASRRNPADERAAGEAEIRAKIADMPPNERPIAERMHELVMAAVPDLMPKTYYGMPAYAKDGKVICFFQPPSKFKVRYWTYGFQPDARLDDGDLWPVAYALTELTPKAEAQISALAKKAFG